MAGQEADGASRARQAREKGLQVWAMRCQRRGADRTLHSLRMDIVPIMKGGGDRRDLSIFVCAGRRSPEKNLKSSDLAGYKEIRLLQIIDHVNVGLLIIRIHARRSTRTP